MKTILLLLTLLTIASCHKKDNTFFETHLPESAEYKNRLAEIINESPADYSYNLKKYIEKDGKIYLQISVKGKGIDALANMEVRNWSKLEGIKRTKGVSYRGAGLKGLKLDIKPTENGAVFIYRDLNYIFD